MKKPRGESSEGSQEREVKEAPAPTVEAARGMVLGPNGTAEPRERLPQPLPVILEIIFISSALEASTTTEPEGAATLPMTSIATRVQSSGPASVGPSLSAAPTPGVARVSILVTPNTMKTLDAGIAERLMGFILQCGIGGRGAAARWRSLATGPRPRPRP